MENKGFFEEIRDELKNGANNFLDDFRTTKGRINKLYNSDETRAYIQNEYAKVERVCPAIANNEKLSNFVNRMISRKTKLEIASNEYFSTAMVDMFVGAAGVAGYFMIDAIGWRVLNVSDMALNGIEAGLLGVSVLAFGKGVLDTARSAITAGDAKKTANKLQDVVEKNTPEDSCGNVVSFNKKSSGIWGKIKGAISNIISDRSAGSNYKDCEVVDSELVEPIIDGNIDKSSSNCKIVQFNDFGKDM